MRITISIQLYKGPAEEAEDRGRKKVDQTKADSRWKCFKNEKCFDSLRCLDVAAFTDPIQRQCSPSLRWWFVHFSSGGWKKNGSFHFYVRVRCNMRLEIKKNKKNNNNNKKKWFVPLSCIAGSWGSVSRWSVRNSPLQSRTLEGKRRRGKLTIFKSVRDKFLFSFHLALIFFF